MWLVLCSSSDASALWVYEGLKQCGVFPLELVLAESLVSSRWEHRLEGNETHLRIVLPDGRVLCSARIRGAINRLFAPAAGIAELAAASDKEYAQAELQAFYLSWLNGLPGVVINRPSPQGLCGPWYHVSEWVYRAGRAGLPTPVHRQSGHDAPDLCFRSLAPEGAASLNFITFADEVFGATLPAPLVRACAKLAEDAGAKLLGLQLYAGDHGEWIFAAATPCPDLSIGGRPLLERLAEKLMRGRQ